MSMSASPHPSRSRKFLLGVILGILIAGFLTPIVLNVHDHLTRVPAAVPDEQVAGLKLLAEKFAGSRYFHPEPENENTGVPEKYYVSTAAVKAQAVHIVSERKLNPDQAKHLDAVIDRLTEPPPSRVTGPNSVNVLRLNLALDEIH